VTFQRARNDGQREARRQAILDTAAAMLDEMPAAELTLNELSRRVGLAKSNVLRYFESREAVLLELLNDFMGRWLADLVTEMAATADDDAPVDSRARHLAETLSQTLSSRTVLCDLLGAQGAVLERNVSVEVAKRHKRSSFTKLATLSDCVRDHLPEIGDGAQWFCLMTLLTAGALSTYVPTPPSLLAAYAEEPELGVLNFRLQDALRIALDATLVGVLPRI
jgi:AcrR family transcriptional regulator